MARSLLLETLSFARTVPDLRQINLCVNATNLAAIALYESLAFKPFGHETGALLIDGKLHDEIYMSLRLNN